MHALIDQARAEVESAGALIDEILFLSELESGKEVVSLGHTAALPVLEDVVAGSRTRRRVPASSSQSRATRPSRCRSARACSAIVAENLAENAIRYAGHGATLHVHRPARRRVPVLTAADDGAGVAERDSRRLFERFYRADAARTSRGTGLGLSIVKHIVVAAGGEIEADGAPARPAHPRTFPARTRGRPQGALASKRVLKLLRVDLLQRLL